MVYYRKYRPQNVAELDLDSVRQRLESILKAKELPHAFLFTGPKGLGKTSAARILAKAINCENNDIGSRILDKGKKEKNPTSKIQHPKSRIEPCNKCEACRSITNGSNLDVLEIDAASNRGIDEIRDLREKIKFAPSSLKKKVYIIDEVHMLTQEAFNALLKTLEEPPSHAIFILCTTEAEKIPLTISSRTFHVNFKKPTKDEVTRSISRIVKSESLDVEKTVLEDIYRLSDGSFRDAAKILEELTFAAGNKKITDKSVEEIYKTGSIDFEVKKLIVALAEKDVKAAISIIGHLSEVGADFKVVVERLAQSLHDMLLSGTDIARENPDIPEFQTSELKKLLGLVNESYRDIKFSVLPQIPLELAAVEWCLDWKLKTQNVKLKTDEESEEAEPVQNEKVGENSKKAESGSKANEEPETKSEQRKANNGSGHGMFAGNARSDNFMAALLMAVKRDNHSIAGILRGCSLVKISDGKVQFETKYKFHKDKLGEAKANSILDMRASEILKEKVHVVVSLTEK